MGVYSDNVIVLSSFFQIQTEINNKYLASKKSRKLYIFFIALIINMNLYHTNALFAYDQIISADITATINTIPFSEAVKQIEKNYTTNIRFKGHIVNTKIKFKPSNSTAIHDIKFILNQANINNYVILDKKNYIIVFLINGHSNKMRSFYKANNPNEKSNSLSMPNNVTQYKMIESENNDLLDSQPLSFEQIEALQKQGSNNERSNNDEPLTTDQIIKLNEINRNSQNVDDIEPLSTEQINKLNHLYQNEFDDKPLDAKQLERLKQIYPSDEQNSIY